MIFRDPSLFSTEVIKSGGENILYINFLGAKFIPSIENSPEVMAKVIDILSQNPDITRMVFVHTKNYSFSQDQVNMLLEISNFYDYLFNKERILSSEKVSLFKDPNTSFSFLFNFLVVLLKQDPVLAYKSLKEEIMRMEKFDKGYSLFLESILNKFKDLSLIKLAEEYLSKEPLLGRKIYSKIFKPDVTPNFIFTRLISRIPEEGEIVEEYKIGDGFDESVVSIIKDKKNARFIYHLKAPEYSLKEKYQYLLDLAKEVLGEHKPSGEEFNDFERTRRVFFNVARDLLRDLAQSKKIEISYKDLDLLASIL
ncbi:MAG: hypothetical protein QW273_02795, partial [Candidatus Pacearchaeota archaeon]